jgi:hypothetical protein
LKSFFIENTDDDIEQNDKDNPIQMYSINTLINIYELIEFLCWEQFTNNLNEQYKMHLTEDMKKKIKKVIESSITEDSLVKKQDLARATRRLISRYLSGKRGDTDIGEFQKLFDYIQRADLWKPEFMDNEDFGTELFTIFENIKREINFITKCGPDNNCDQCNKKREEEGLENPCQECDKCNAGLRIGQAMEFYELINDEIVDLDKFSEKKDANNKEERVETNEIVNKEDENEETQEINTNSIQPEENNENEEINLDEDENNNELDEEEGDNDNIFEDDEGIGEI